MKHLKDILLIGLFIVIIILLLKKCGGGSGKVIESVKIDTVYKEVKGDSVFIPVVREQYIPGKVPKALEKWDTLYIEGFTEVDTLAILRDYHSFNLYGSVIDIKDDSTKYGTVTIDDTVTRNKIVGRGTKFSLRIPEVTKTITISQRRNQVYLGVGLWGNEKDFVGGYEVNLSLKTKQDRIIGVGYEQIFNGGHYYKIEYRHKLSFKK